MLMTAFGFAETIITAQDYAVDSDVVLESAVNEVKSIPQDAINVVGDVLKYTKDEAVTAAQGVDAAFDGATPHEKVKKAGSLAVDKAWDSSNDIVFRSYKVSDELGDLLQSEATDGAAQSMDVRSFFKGIQFPERTSIVYMPEFKSLFVRQTMPNILAVERMLAEYQREQRSLFGHQVEIEAKFIEVGQSTLDELGFAWRFSGKGSDGDLRLFDDLYLPAGQDLLASGLRTASMAFGSAPSAGMLAASKTTGSLQWDLLISALEQSDDSDVLSAPRVVTRDGNTAVIQVGEEEMVPKAFEVMNQDTSPSIEHTDWDLELMGVFMEVTPEIRDDGFIDLSLHPRVMDLIGYDSYQVVPSYEVPKFPRITDGGSIANFPDLLSRQVEQKETVENPIVGTLPYLRIRELETEMTIADGSTIGMGGLIYDKLETFRDKVPVLGSIPLVGRLFRSEGERSVKRNLMIFVTATQVDVNGQTAAELALKK
jgi:general secretion pathway protein D